MSNDTHGKNGSNGDRSESMGVVEKRLKARLAHVLGRRSMTRLLRDVLWGCFLVTALAGCPVDWAMEDGFLDRAAAKDIRENSTEMTCPPGEHLALPPKCTAPSATCKKKCIADQ